MAHTKEIVIEGHDGGAKTPVACRSAEALRSMGYRVGIYAPFQLVNEAFAIEEAARRGVAVETMSRADILACDIYNLWSTRNGAARAIERIRKIIAHSRQEALEMALDLIIWDRHWITVLTQIYQDPTLLPLWDDFPPTVFLEAPMGKTLDCVRFSYDVPWTDSDDAIRKSYDLFLEIVHRYPQHLLARYRVETRTQDLSPIVADIVRLTYNRVLT
jgi:hypothetical protein